jgi:subtilase family serine protease
MRRSVLAAVSAAATLVLSSVALATSAGAAPPTQPSLAHRNVHVCGTPAAGTASCDAIRHETVDRDGRPVPALTAPAGGYLPTDLRAAYNLDGATSGGRTVAIVDAYDDPQAESDLAVYRGRFGLGDCTTANGCFTKIDQYGGNSYPAPDGGWSQEISLDLDMVSATCPDCRILLVEARSTSFGDLAEAVDTAAHTPGVVAISNSYGGRDVKGTSVAPSYAHPGIAVTASSGDSGYGPQSPASFDGVVAVGGTSLYQDSSSRGYSESAWSGAGSGCSTLNAKPKYQTSATSCSGKAIADVSAVADPNTGVAVYDSFAYQGDVDWMVFGGTSAASPIIAGVFAQGHALQSGATPGAASLWSSTASLNDVTSGSNGHCRTKVWCTAGQGWDGPTGLGTPNGTGAF